MLQSISGAEKFAFENLHVKNCRSALKLEGKEELAVGFPKTSLRLVVPGNCAGYVQAGVRWRHVK